MEHVDFVKKKRNYRGHTVLLQGLNRLKFLQIGEEKRTANNYNQGAAVKSCGVLIKIIKLNDTLYPNTDFTIDPLGLR